MDNRKMIYLDDAIDALAYFTEKSPTGRTAQEVVKALPPAQPEERMLHESCTDCPLYDKDRHSCPRFNKVIPETLRELRSAHTDYTELKREFILMASYIDVLLECSDEQKETLIGFISRLSEYMPWTDRD